MKRGICNPDGLADPRITYPAAAPTTPPPVRSRKPNLDDPNLIRAHRVLAIPFSIWDRDARGCLVYSHELAEQRRKIWKYLKSRTNHGYGMTAPKIAEITGTSRDSVRWALNRCDAAGGES